MGYGFSWVHFFTLGKHYKYTLKLWKNQSQNLHFLSFLLGRGERVKINKTQLKHLVRYSQESEKSFIGDGRNK